MLILKSIQPLVSLYVGRLTKFVSNAPQADIKDPGLVGKLNDDLVDIISLVFVLSAIAPGDFKQVFENLGNCLKPGGVILFRDYAVNDMAMIRFANGTKIGERMYLRQDGTTSYFFTKEEISALCCETGLKPVDLSYIHRRTVNLKEKVDAGRIFLQGKFVKEK